MAEEHSGSAAVVMDQDHGDESLHDLDPAAASGGLAGRGPPRAMVDDLDANASGLGPEGQLDAVARGLVHGQHQVDLGVPEQGERRQPTVDLRAEGGEVAGMRWPGPMHELSTFAPVDRGGRLGHVVPQGARSCSSTNRATGSRATSLADATADVRSMPTEPLTRIQDFRAGSRRAIPSRSPPPAVPNPQGPRCGRADGYRSGATRHGLWNGPREWGPRFDSPTRSLLRVAPLLRPCVGSAAGRRGSVRL